MKQSSSGRKRRAARRRRELEARKAQVRARSAQVHRQLVHDLEHNIDVSHLSLNNIAMLTPSQRADLERAVIRASGRRADAMASRRAERKAEHDRRVRAILTPSPRVNRNTMYMASRQLTDESVIQSMPPRQARLARNANNRILAARQRADDAANGRWMTVNDLDAMVASKILGTGQDDAVAFGPSAEESSLRSAARGIAAARRRMESGSMSESTYNIYLASMARKAGMSVSGVGGASQRARMHQLAQEGYGEEQARRIFRSEKALRKRGRKGPGSLSKSERRAMRDAKAVERMRAPGMSPEQTRALLRALDLLGYRQWYGNLTAAQRDYLHRNTQFVADVMSAIDSPPKSRRASGADGIASMGVLSQLIGDASIHAAEKMLSLAGLG